jgi:hypothetical protein
MESILYMVFENGLYWHEGTSYKFCQLYGKNKSIHKVRVIENKEGKSKYWAVWEYERNGFVNIWPNKGQTTMCYPYGIEPVEKQGEGKLCNVDIEFIESVTENRK